MTLFIRCRKVAVTSISSSAKGLRTTMGKVALCSPFSDEKHFTSTAFLQAPERKQMCDQVTAGVTMCCHVLLAIQLVTCGSCLAPRGRFALERLP